MTSEFVRIESLHDSLKTVVQLPTSIVLVENLIKLKIVILLYTEILQIDVQIFINFSGFPANFVCIIMIILMSYVCNMRMYV